MSEALAAPPIEDDGFAEIVIGSVTLSVDLWETHNRLIEIRDQHSSEDDPTAPRLYNAAVAAYVESLGFGRVSHRAGAKFAAAVSAACGALAKKDEAGAASPSPTPGSADSTDSQSGD